MCWSYFAPPPRTPRQCLVDSGGGRLTLTEGDRAEQLVSVGLWWCVSSIPPRPHPTQHSAAPQGQPSPERSIERTYGTQIEVEVTPAPSLLPSLLTFDLGGPVQSQRVQR